MTQEFPCSSHFNPLLSLPFAQQCVSISLFYCFLNTLLALIIPRVAGEFHDHGQVKHLREQQLSSQEDFHVEVAGRRDQPEVRQECGQGVLLWSCSAVQFICKLNDVVEAHSGFQQMSKSLMSKTQLLIILNSRMF